MIHDISTYHLPTHIIVHVLTRHSTRLDLYLISLILTPPYPTPPHPQVPWIAHHSAVLGRRDVDHARQPRAVRDPDD